MLAGGGVGGIKHLSLTFLSPGVEEGLVFSGLGVLLARQPQ